MKRRKTYVAPLSDVVTLTLEGMLCSGSTIIFPDGGTAPTDSTGVDAD